MIRETASLLKLDIDKSDVNDFIDLDSYGNGVFVDDYSHALTITPPYFPSVFYFNGSTYTDYTNAAKTSAGTSTTAGDVQIFAVAGATNGDYFYVGSDYKFQQAYFKIVANAYSQVVAFEYWNGAVWSALTVTDNTTNFTVAGTVEFTPPADWATVAVNGATRYWVRFSTSVDPGGSKPLTANHVSPIATTSRINIKSLAGNSTSIGLNSDDQVYFKTNTPTAGVDIDFGNFFTVDIANKLFSVNGAGDPGSTGMMQILGNALGEDPVLRLTRTVSTISMGFIFADTGSYSDSFQCVIDPNADVLQIEPSGSANAFNMTAAGDIGIGLIAPIGKLHIVGVADNEVLVVQGFSTQTNNLQEWWSSAAELTHITGTGVLQIDHIGEFTGAHSVFFDNIITTSVGIVPDANDGAYLGAAGTAFSDLFLAEGGVINWDSGDCTITQAGNVLTIAGADITCDDITLTDGSNIITNATTGTIIAGATSQKLGFWGKAPIIQPAAALQAAITNSTGGSQDGILAASGITYNAAIINNNFTDIFALLDAIRTALVNAGIIKGAA